MRIQNIIPGWLMLLFILAAVGCHDPEPFDINALGYQSPITEADITYTELATRYNQTVEPFESLWSRNSIDIEWFEVDEDGDRDFRSESGDGKFIMRRPGDTALIIEKLGRILMWAGSNRERYWLFEQIDSDDKSAYIGSFDKLNEPGRQAYPLPVRPDVVPILIGLTPLPPAEAQGVEPAVDEYDGQYLVEIDGLRMLIDKTTFRPSRIDLTDPSGFSVLTSKLSGTFAAEADGVPEEQWPILCKKAEIYVSGYESRLTVEMDYATTNPRRVRDQMFDFESLMQTLEFKPKWVQSLDRD